MIAAAGLTLTESRALAAKYAEVAAKHAADVAAADGEHAA